jgi:anionic cell wall polymer biosynthesis LytR-Cps2A-Psr (LCP) family protein
MKISFRLYRLLAKIILVIAAAVLIIAAAFVALRIHGKNKLYGKTDSSGPSLSAVVPSDETGTENGTVTDPAGDDDDWQEGDVRYKGIHYRYNSDILTFLFLGIDKSTKVGEVKNGIDGGQSDAIFLLVLNPDTKKMSVIAVNRNTMADVAVYDKEGRYVDNMTLQICLQHGYGDGAASSCERSKEAVSELFYNLPIHGYCAVNMGAISLINDAVGGVEVTALEDVPHSKIKEGDTLTLTGQDAYRYVHNRNTDSFGSADRRLERQKQYMKAYIAKAKGRMKEDITLPITLYNTIKDYTVTDISVDEISYLATQAAGYSFDADDFYTLEGETVMGEKFEEFYVDETALYELILKVFYTET